MRNRPDTVPTPPAARPAPPGDPDPVARLRSMSAAELAAVGQDGLIDHVRDRAIQIHRTYHGIRPSNLGTFLEDRSAVRYPVRLILEFGNMAEHQFAQPEPDVGPSGERRIALFVRPTLGERPDLLCLAVVYMIPVINYGDAATDPLCLLFGATAQGLMAEEFYRQICAMADFSGADSRFGL